MTINYLDLAWERWGIPEYRERGGQYHLPCPECGKPVKEQQTHFSIKPFEDAENGVFHCFVCGFQGVISQFAWEHGWLAGNPDAVPHRPIERIYTPPKPPTEFPIWMARGVLPDQEPVDELLIGILWDAYKPLSYETIQKWGLTAGFPPYQLKYGGGNPEHLDDLHLLYPVIRSGKLVMVRHRLNSYAAQNGEKIKWMTQGTPKRLLGIEHITTGVPLIILENFVDGLILQERMNQPVNTIASSGGAGGFDANWIKPLLAMTKPSRVLLGLDHDEAGQRATQKIARFFWDEAGVACHGIQWRDADAAKMDIGDILIETDLI